MKRREGFTLIELLVVISIVALLSSIVMTSLNTAREKSRIAASAQFEANVYHALGSESTGLYLFEEGSGTLAADGSAGIAGTVSNGTWDSSTYGPASKYALAFNGSNSYVDLPLCGMSKRLANVPGVTSSRWLYLNSLPSSGNTMVVDFVNSGGGGSFGALSVNSNGTVGWQGRSTVSDALQTLNSNSVLALGKWYNIVTSANYVDKTASIFIDGKLDAKATGLGFGSSSFTQQAPCVSSDRIGSSPTPDRYLNGKVDSVRFYGQAL